MTASEPWTIGRLLTWTTDYLRRRGAEQPRLDAEVLLAHACGRERIALYAAFHEEPAEEVRTAFRELVRQRAEGTPVAYLVGRKEFYSLPFRVTSDVLVPRPETEFLVIEALELLKARRTPRTPSAAPAEDVPAEEAASSDTSETAAEPTAAPPAAAGPAPRVADVGVGSGAICISIARHAPDAVLVGIDISPAALAVAAQNAAALGVAERIEFQQGDLLAGRPAERSFDLIVSNPPYVSSAEWQALPAEVRDQEPRLALEAGPTGTEIIQRLIPQAAERLAAGGWLLVEVSPMIAPAVRDLLARDERFEPAQTVKDLAGLARVIKARRVA